MNHLLQINLGPVQGFIATARRSRDLWFGSYILSELSKSVAQALHHQGARLVFPFVDDLDQQLAPDSALLVTNIVFAELDAPDLAAARAVIELSQHAATERWQSLCNEALRQIDRARQTGSGTVDQLLDDTIWQAQLGDVVEIYSGLVPVDSQGYAQANDRLRELLANRKNTRSFAPYSDNFHRPKSSLDGAQSSVLRPRTSAGSDRLRARLGIEPTEQLDTAAMVKRVVGRERGFVPTARVAAQPWLELASTDRHFETLKSHLTTLAERDQGTRLGGRYAEYPWLSALPFDGQLLYRHRVQAQRARLQEAPWNDDGSTSDLLDDLDKTLAKLYSAYGAPNPYYGLLLADGDKMGQLIDKANQAATTGDGHRAISRALSAFAQRVPEVMSLHQGACIYSGGDDVLGLVPLHKIIDTAQALRQSFAQQLDQVAQDNGLSVNERPTLSVGVALVHFQQPLGDARQLAGVAEKTAKGGKLPAHLQRNALCLLAQPRAGHAITIRIRWDDQPALDRLSKWTGLLLNQTLPRGLPHELHATYARCLKAFSPLNPATFETFKAYWHAQLSAVLNRKQAQDADLPSELKAHLLQHLCGDDLTQACADDHDPLQHLLMARWLSGQTAGDDECCSV